MSPNPPQSMPGGKKRNLPGLAEKSRENEGPKARNVGSRITPILGIRKGGSGARGRLRVHWETKD